MDVDAKDFLARHLKKDVDLSGSELMRIMDCFSVLPARKASAIFKQGDTVRHVYFVVSGLLKLVYHDDEGKEHILSFAMEEWWETDFQAFYQGSLSHLSLLCIENSVLLQLSSADYRQLCASIPKFEHFLFQKSISGHIASQRRILSLLTTQARERYELLIKQYPALIQRLPKAQLAAYLGVSRETLSRLYTGN